MLISTPRSAAMLLLLAAAACGSEPGDQGAGGAGSASGGSAAAGKTGSAAAGSGSGHGASSSGGGGSSGSASNGPASGGSVASGGGASNGGSSGSSGAPAGSGVVGCHTAGDGKSTIGFVNHCSGTLSFRGSGIDGGDLAPGEVTCRDVGNASDGIPAIRFWGYIDEDPGPERYTLAELTLNTDFNDFDWYNISHVDAHNLPMQIVPADEPKCRTLTCADSLLANCPEVGQEKDADGVIISCYSPDKNDPNSPVAQYFEMSCADAYSWSGDDQGSVAACAGEDYDIIWCP